MKRCLLITLVVLTVLYFSLSLLAEEVIKFDPPEWNVGEVEIGQVFSKEIRVKTTPAYAEASAGRDSADITNVRPTCECLYTSLLNSKITLQSDGIISATLHIDNTLGAYFRVFFYVHFSDAKSPQQFVKFYITGKVKGKGLPPSEIVIFHTVGAKDWTVIKQRLDGLKEKNPSLIIKEYVAKDIDSYRARTQFEKQYSVNKYADVEMFTTSGAFIGVDGILKELDRIKNLGSTVTSGAVEQIGSSGKTVADDKPLPKGALEILYFYSIGCGGCIEIEGTLFPKLNQRFGERIFVSHLDIGEIKNYMRLIDMEAKYKIKANAPVSVFVGDTVLLGSKEILGKTEAVVESQLLMADGKLLIADNTGGRAVTGTAQAKIQERFRSFSVLAVIGAGLLDGINPCAFATIIFFISFLTFAGRSRREIMLVGVFYTIAVFTTYLFLGVGIFKAIQSLAAYATIAKIVLYLTVALVFCLAGLSLYDIVIYLKTRKTGGITLQLPMTFKQRIHSVIRENVKPGSLVIGAIVIGFLVTLFEAACTGQVYLPTIVFVLKDPTLKVNAILYLVLYNLMFIVPLVVIFILAYIGVKSDRLAEFSQNNLVLTKLLMTLLFIGLGILILAL